MVRENRNLKVGTRSISTLAIMIPTVFPTVFPTVTKKCRKEVLGIVSELYIYIGSLSCVEIVTVTSR